MLETKGPASLSILPFFGGTAARLARAGRSDTEGVCFRNLLAPGGRRSRRSGNPRSHANSRRLVVRAHDKTRFQLEGIQMVRGFTERSARVINNQEKLFFIF